MSLSTIGENADFTKKRIVMTGGTAGIGLAAAQHLRDAADVTLLVGARGKPRAELQSSSLDLTDLESVRQFSEAVKEWLGGAELNVLILNAAIQFNDVKHRTKDGYETTFAVNHLAHYLLLRLLEPCLARDAVVIITTSNLHDPNTNPVAPPEHADAILLANGQVRLGSKQGPRSGLRAYATSKLCNILTARTLKSSYRNEGKLSVIAFNPGFTPGTRLMREQSSMFKLIFNVMGSIMRSFRKMNTVESGGRILSDLALGRTLVPAGQFYASQNKRSLTWPQPGTMVSDEDIGRKLWNDSADMVGLTAAC